MADSRTRRLELVLSADEQEAVAGVPLADVVTLQSRVSAQRDVDDEVGFFHDTLAEYSWARDVAGVGAATLPKLLAPVIEVCRFYDVVPWRLSSRDLDAYFAGPGKRKHATMRKKIINTIATSRSWSSATGARSAVGSG